MQKNHQSSTLAVHAGTHQEAAGGLNTPVYADSAYPYLTQAEVRYPRYFNTPNHQAVVKKVAALEGAETGLVFSSGMAAISSALQAHLKSGDSIVIAHGIYGGTDDLCRNHLPRLGIEVIHAHASAEALLAACKNNTRMIYCETPCNPRLQVIDLDALCTGAKQRNALVMIDNTFATPILQNPITFGADIVMHSATKYMGGHSDLCAGVIVGSDEIVKPIRGLALRLGGSLNAQMLSLLERSIKTLSIRVERQSQNALQIAQWLEAQPQVEAVDYPGLTSHKQHQLAKKQMRAFGGMLTVRLKAPLTAETFEQRLALITSAVSLGGVESTCCQPIRTSHALVPDDQCTEQGVDGQLLRVSCGIENADDLISDLQQALTA